MKWILPSENLSDPSALLDYILDSRGITDKSSFLNPSSSQIHDPFLMYGMKDAALAIISAVESGKKIFIHGDFDVDGVTATSIVWRYLKEVLDADVMPYIPSRFDEGYGLSDESLQSIINAGGQFVITVDCGVKDVDLVEKYKDKLDFVITDHHSLREVDLASSSESSSKKSEKIVGNHIISAYAKAVVHPQLNNQYPFTEICGAMVAWKLCCAINSTKNLQTNMHEYLDLVAMGTVCDVMPLINENRAVVGLGLEQLKKTKNEGLQALMEVSAISQAEVSAYHFGFMLGPKINAAGRIGHALDAVRLLCTNSKDTAYKIARNLVQLNLQRQDLTSEYYKRALEQVESDPGKSVYLIHGENWPEGIVGLIAGKLTHLLYRPVLVASLKDNEIKGSARSIEALHIANILKKLEHRLIRFGGHAQAAGFTLQPAQLDSFKTELEDLVSSTLSQEDLVQKLKIDALLAPEILTPSVVESLSQMEPFGTSNLDPVFAIQNMKIQKKDLLGREKKHVKLVLTDGNSTLTALGFGMREQLDSFPVGQTMDVAGNLMLNNWNGRSEVQVKIVDVKV